MQRKTNKKPPQNPKQNKTTSNGINGPRYSYNIVAYWSEHPIITLTISMGLNYWNAREPIVLYSQQATNKTFTTKV